MKSALLLIFLILTTSCAKTDEEACRSAKAEAKYHLTKRSCSKAISTISGSCDGDDGEYISILASAHACSSGYSELDLFDLDIDNISSTSLLGSLASLSTSNETEADSDGFVAIQTAIQTILSSTSGEPSAAARDSKFGSAKATDLNFQALFMLVVQLGKYFAYYGNADAAGVKGLGALGNTCLLNYSNSDAINWVSQGITGNCGGANEGSADLANPTPAADILRRTCEGIVLFNNLMDILGAVDLTSSVYGDLSSIKTEIDGAYDIAIDAEFVAYSTATISSVRNIRSISACEDLSTEEREKYFAIFFEIIYQ